MLSTNNAKSSVNIHRSQQVIDNSPVGIFYTDEQGDWSYVNKRWCEITGLGPDEANHERWLQALHPEDRLRCKAEWHQALDHRGFYQSEHRYFHPNGKITWALAQAYPETYKIEDGCRFIGILIDISTHKLTEMKLIKSHYKLTHQHEIDVEKLSQTQTALNIEKAKYQATASALSESEARWKSFVENTFDYVLTVNRNHVITFINRSINGYPLTKLIGKKIEGIFSLDHSGVLKNALNIVFNKGEAVSYETKLTNDEQTTWYACRVGPVIRNGEVIEATLITTNITERIVIEEQIQKHQNELTRFATHTSMLEVASGLAHELNQPLTAINNYLKGMVRRFHDQAITKDKLMEVANQVENQIERANEIMTRMRNFVKHAAVDKRLCSINQIIEEAITFIDPDILEQTNIRISIDSSLPPLYVDKIQIEQVIINIIQNAFEASASAGNANNKVCIHVETSLIENHAVINIIDEGSGINGKIIGRLFDAFVTSKAKGLGMGLAICRSIIEAHNGHLSAVNNPDKGATFTIKLPIH